MAPALPVSGRDKAYATCGARKRQGEGFCTRPAGWGTEHAGEGRCKLHGGCTPTQARNGQRRLAERAALSSIADQVVAPIANPISALADLAAESVALKAFLAGRVAELASLENVTEGNSEQIRAVVAAYERAMDRAGKFLGDWVKLGLDARAVEVSEREADALEAVVLRALAAAGLPEELEQRFVRALAVELRAGGSDG